jgi:hypothetical protein
MKILVVAGGPLVENILELGRSLKARLHIDSVVSSHPTRC